MLVLGMRGWLWRRFKKRNSDQLVSHGWKDGVSVDRGINCNGVVAVSTMDSNSDGSFILRGLRDIHT